MKQRFRFGFALALVCLLALRSSFAHAEPPAQASAPVAAEGVPRTQTEQKKEQAKARFLRGLELIQNENWDAALAEFLASRELYPTKVALKNAAISLRQLK